MENSTKKIIRDERDEFRKQVKEEWGLMWRERFDDRVRAEGVSARDYPLVFMDRGFVIFASRGTRTPSFPEIMDCWASRGRVYSPEPSVGGWGKFMRATFKKALNSRAKQYLESASQNLKQQPKKGGRGWLHK